MALSQSLGQDGYWLKTVDDDLYIVGETDFGVLFGVYGYLERAFNFDCFTADCYTISEVEDWELSDLDATETPSLAIRNCGNRFILKDENTLRRMRYTDRDSTLFVGSPSAHTTFNYLPVDSYKDTNREWYSSYNAEVTYSADQTQLCYTAHGDSDSLAKMQETVFETMKTNFIANTTGYLCMFSQMDSYTRCGCDACTAARNTYGSDAGAIVLFCNALAEKLSAWMATAEEKPYARDFRILFLAYDLTLTAPTGVTCNDNVSVIFAPVQMDYQHNITDAENAKYYEALKGWNAICKDVSFYTYQSNYNYMLAPFYTTDSLAVFYREAAKTNNAYWFFDSGHSGAENATATGWQVLKGYLSSKLGWYAGEDMSDAEYSAYVKGLTDQFFDGYFGAASEKMRFFYESYRVAAAKAADALYADFSHAAQGVTSICRNPMGYDYSNPGTYSEKYFTKAVLDEWLGYIDEALKLVEEGDAVYDRIVLERIAVYYMIVELYSSRLYYSTEYITELKSAVKADCARFGIVYASTGTNGTVKVEDLWE